MVVLLSGKLQIDGKTVKSDHSEWVVNPSAICNESQERATFIFAGLRGDARSRVEMRKVGGK